MQVERVPSPESLRALALGVTIQGHRTLPCRAALLDPPPAHPVAPGADVTSLVRSARLLLMLIVGFTVYYGVPYLTDALHVVRVCGVLSMVAAALTAVAAAATAVRAAWVPSFVTLVVLAGLSVRVFLMLDLEGPRGVALPLLILPFVVLFQMRVVPVRRWFGVV